MEKMKPCPFCGGTPTILICDDEGNIQDDDYESDPWSGIGYQIGHSIIWQSEIDYRCPIANQDADEAIGATIYSSRIGAIKTWNQRIK